MTLIENARADDAGAAKASRLFTAEFTSNHAVCTSPCTKCKWFYAENIRTRRQKWPACNLSSSRNPGRTCRWFVQERGVV